MESSDSSSPPASSSNSYVEFMDKLRTPSGSEIYKTIRMFCYRFPFDKPRQEQANLVHDFLDQAEQALLRNPLWKGSDETQLEVAREGLEKLVMKNLHAKLFGTFQEEIAADEEVAKKLFCLQFVAFEHLDIPEEQRDPFSLELAQTELSKMNKYKAPRDKIVCIVNCCRVINSLLARSRSPSNPPGCDDFLPVLIYVVLKTQPQRLHTNLDYISTFRHPNRLVSEPLYFLTNLNSALVFLRNLSAKDLTIEPSVYADSYADREKGWEDEKAALAKQAAAEAAAQLASNTSSQGESTPTSSNPSASPPVPTQHTGPSDLRMERAESTILAELKQLNLDFNDTPESKYSENESAWTHLKASQSDSVALKTSVADAAKLAAFASVQDEVHQCSHLTLDYAGTTLQDLRWSEVPALLTEYKQLASLLVSLRKVLSDRS
eukprot:GILK01010016.1.p1 GENE.GILK01010016.1~~GILK01010016.1.p1  ORF type:complete len:447 (-),score=82.70 GILK01010016.1:467-1771(-)